MFQRILLSTFLLMTSFCISSISNATVTSTSNQIIYAGDGVNTVFSFPYNVFNSASENDLVVSKQVVATGAITTLAINTDYTVALIHSIPSPGSITLLAGALPVGTNLSILRQLPLTQQVKISNDSPTPAATTNAVYDRSIMISQQLQQQVTRAILQNVFSTTQISLPAGVAGYVLCWDSTGMILTNCIATSTGVTIPIPIPNTYLSALTSANLVSGASFFNLSSIPSGAGLIPVANIDTGVTAGKIVALNGSAQLPAVSGALLTNLPPPPYAKITNTQTSGTGGGSATNGAWRAAVLNTKDIDASSIVTLASNQITLAAGTYKISSIMPFNLCQKAQTRLQNITDTLTTLPGTTVYTSAGATAVTTSNIVGTFTIAGTKTFEVQYQVELTVATTGQGVPASFGTEVYTQVELTKLL